MNCKDIARLSPLYLSGELDAPNTVEFAEHLQGCRACVGEIEKSVRLDALLRSSVLSEEIDIAAVDRRVREHIAPHRLSFSARWLAVAGFVAVTLLGAALIYRTVFALQPPRLCVAAAQDYRNEVIFRQHRRWLSDDKAIADLAKRTGLTGSWVTSVAPAGYRLEEGKLCRLDGRLFLHLVYAQGGHQFSVYMRSAGDQPLSGEVRETVSGKHLYEAEASHEYMAYFQTGQLTAIFVTNESSQVALSLARSAAEVL